MLFFPLCCGIIEVKISVIFDAFSNFFDGEVMFYVRFTSFRANILNNGSALLNFISEIFAFDNCMRNCSIKLCKSIIKGIKAEFKMVVGNHVLFSFF